MTVIDLADLSCGMIVLRVFSFDPARLSRRKEEGPVTLFYDGTCGLCHGLVRFVLAEDAKGQGFRFAPLQGRTFQAEVPEALRRGLPGSIVVKKRDGELLSKSAAVLFILKSLGGHWRLASMLGCVIPRVLRDGIYDLVARFRHRWFARPREICPTVPAHLRGRFLA